jgi:hypothetical protein
MRRHSQNPVWRVEGPPRSLTARSKHLLLQDAVAVCAVAVRLNAKAAISVKLCTLSALLGFLTNWRKTRGARAGSIDLPCPSRLNEKTTLHDVAIGVARRFDPADASATALLLAARRSRIGESKNRETGGSMSKAVSGLQDAATNRDQKPQPEEIRRQLAAVLASPVFHGSKRCQQFLEYVCERSLAGDMGALKERTIAVEVFGRQAHIDLGEDTIVRVGAREVRKRLAQFYITPEGAAAEIRIDLPSGSYAPDFHYAAAAPEKPVAMPPVEPAPARSSRRALLTGCIAVSSAAAAATLWKLSTPSPNAAAFQRFWDPVFRAQDPLLIAIAHPIVYHPSGRALRLSEQNLPQQEIPVQRPIDVPPNQLNGSDIVPVFNQYVGFGDMVAANEVTAMLARRSRPVRVRLASGIEFADLRKAQTLLIGAVTNRWTMEMQQAWRFRLSWKPGTSTVIVDTQSKPNGGPSQWSVVAKDDGSTPDDYMLVCRIHSAYTGGLILVAAGLKQFGTEAAGRLLTDPEQLGAILDKLQPGWESKNLQVVLHARVIANTPAMPEVVASYVW